VKVVKKWLPRLLPWVITLLLVRFWVAEGGDWHQLRQELSGASPAMLVLAIGCQAAAFAAVTWLNQLLLRPYQIRVPWFRQYNIQFAMAFVETAIPSGAVSGLVLRARLLKPYGASADVATITTLVETLFIAVTVLAPALFVGAFLAVDRGAANLGSRYFLLFLTLFTLLMAGIWRWRRHWLSSWRRSAWTWAARVWDTYPVRRWPLRLADFPSERVGRRARDLVSALHQMLRQESHLVLASLLLRSFFEVLAFALCFYAFGEDLPIRTLLLLYTVTITVNTLGSLPGGVGLAEVSLAAIFSQFGLSPASALAVAFAYRLTGYWLPRACGGLSWLWLERRHRLELASQISA